MKRFEHRRPKLRFGEERQARPPMVEKTIDRAGRIDRHELMQRAVGQTGPGDLGRGDRDCREQHGQPAGDARRSISRQRRNSLANAGRVDPDEWSLWPLQAGNTEALVLARRIFLTLTLPPSQHCAAPPARRSDRPPHRATRTASPMKPPGFVSSGSQPSTTASCGSSPRSCVCTIRAYLPRRATSSACVPDSTMRPFSI